MCDYRECVGDDGRARFFNISEHADEEHRGARADLKVSKGACRQDLSDAILGSVVAPWHVAPRERSVLGRR